MSWPEYTLTQLELCPNCEGGGMLRTNRGDGDVIIACPTCNGSGILRSEIDLIAALHDLKARGKLP